MRTDRRTNMTKLIVAFRNFAKAPKTQNRTASPVPVTSRGTGTVPRSIRRYTISPFGTSSLSNQANKRGTSPPNKTRNISLYLPKECRSTGHAKVTNLWKQVLEDVRVGSVLGTAGTRRLPGGLTHRAPTRT
jgi:hypothetical protein